MEASVQPDEATRHAIEREFVRILHNVHEHIEHLRHAYSDAVRGETKDLLRKHIIHEEQRNFEEASRLRERAGGYLDWELKVLQDHSTFIRKVAEGEEVDPQVGLRMLHHFEEEHEELFARFGDPEYHAAGESESAASEVPADKVQPRQEKEGPPKPLEEEVPPAEAEIAAERLEQPRFTVGKPEVDERG